MAIDPKAVSTNGYWLNTATELQVRISSWGYIGSAFSPIPSLVNLLREGWITLRGMFRLRG